MKKVSAIFILMAVCLISFGMGKYPKNIVPPHRQELIVGTFGSPPKLTDGSVSMVDLIKQLKDLHANTYNWLITTDSKSFEQLKDFLPLAKKDSINVWVTIIPPTEQKGMAKQYSTDLKKWATDLATLSVANNNLKAWSVDDFDHNLKLFTPKYVSEFQAASRKINPDFKFIPTCYYKFITPKFVANYGSLIDGILFPYRNESATANLKDYANAVAEINTLKGYFGSNFLIIVDVYSSPHSVYGDPSPTFVTKVIEAGFQNADGVIIYRHPNPKWDAEKYKTVKTAFTNWFLQKK